MQFDDDEDSIYYRSLSQVAEEIGVSRQRVQFLEASGISKLKRKWHCSDKEVLYRLAYCALHQKQVR